MFTPKIFVVLAAVGATAVASTNSPSPVWWLGLFVAVASAVVAYLQANK